MTEAILDRAESVVAGTTPIWRIGQAGELGAYGVVFGVGGGEQYYGAGGGSGWGEVGTVGA